MFSELYLLVFRRESLSLRWLGANLKERRKYMNKIIQDQLETLKALCERYKVKSLYAFGSVNTPRFNEKSDIDLLIDFEPDVSIEEYTDYFFLLREKLAELFKRKIDLVTRRSLSNPFFIEDVERSKQLLYGAS